MGTPKFLSLFFSIVLCLGLVCVRPVRVCGQVLYGSIVGTVFDESRRTVPGAEITATNVNTNYVQSGYSNATGNYGLLNVPYGTYRVDVSLPGFKEYQVDNLVVTAGGISRMDVTLQIGEISQRVEVSAAATALKTDGADISVQLEAKEIGNLPLNSYRNYQSLLNLIPGATPPRFQNSILDTPARALTTNINGTNRNSNTTRIDGAQSVNIWLPHHAAYVPPAETIELVNVATSSFDAEQGFAGGAAITVITKSGTNDFHGSGFFFHENSALNARDFFNFVDEDGDGKADKPAGRRHIWGGTIGGPVVKDRLFFFAGFEATQQAVAMTRNKTLPTADQREGDFSAFLPQSEGGACDPVVARCTVIYDPLTGNPDGTGRSPFPQNIIPEGRLSAPALKMQSLLPLPNLPGLISNYEVSGQEVMNRYNTDVKVDWYRNESHRLWGKFSWMDALVANKAIFGPGGGGSVGGSGDGTGDTDVKVYGVGHNWTFSPTFLADGAFGFTDMDQFVEGEDFGLGNFGQDVLGIPGTNVAPGQEQACIVDGVNRCGGLPSFSVAGFVGFGQPAGWSPLYRNENSITFTHNFSWSRANHEIRFGYDLVKHRLEHWQPELGAGPRGGFTFSRQTTALKGGAYGYTDQNAWASYLLGYPSRTGKSLQWELMTANEWQHALYVRDRWQVTPNLTLTLGLRWEYYPLVTRDNRKMEHLDLTRTMPCEPGDSAPSCFVMVLDNNIKVSKALFAPRLGFAYRLTQNDVIRVGYGITNSPLPFARPLRGFYPLNVAGDFQAEDPFVPFTTLEEGIPAFVGPDVSPGAEIPLPSYVLQRTMPADEITRGYIQSWNFAYERRLPAELVMSLTYVGTQTVHQLADQSINWSPPGGGNTGRQLYPQSAATIVYWDGWLSSNYHALQVVFNRRFTDGLFLRGSYTYSRAINMTDDEGWAGLAWNDPEIISRNRAPAGYNIPHMMRLGALYELPSGIGSQNAFGSLLRDWQLGIGFAAVQNRQFGVASGGPINSRENAQTADQVKDDVVKLGGIGVGQPYYDPTAFAPVARVPGKDCTNLDCYGNSGRNILRGPASVDLSCSLVRVFPIREKLRLQFRSEFRNLTNTPHFGSPISFVNSNAFMQITGTSAPGREIRLALKFEF